VAFLVLLLIAGFFGYRVTTPQERARMADAALVFAGRARQAALREHAALGPYHEALRARTRFALVTPALALVNIAVFVLMIFGAGAVSDPETLIAWGASVGPRTTNGEWWRVVTSLFVHNGFIPLVMTLVGLLQVGLVVERMVGPLTFGAAYFSAGILASLVTVSVAPMTVTGGAVHAVLGVYGLAIAAFLWAFRSPIGLPLVALRTMAPAVVLFLLYNASAVTSSSGLVALATGAAGGLVLARGVAASKPPIRRLSIASAAALVLTIAAAVPIRGIADVRPELARVVEIEAKTAGAYQIAVERFRKGRMSANALADLVDKTIVPELQAMRTRLSEVNGVPDQHQPLVAAADEYLRLRDESWRQRSAALRKSSIPGLREADKTERASLDAFKRFAPPDPA
jgi:membrane associated rhomboid family serine protease